MGGDIAGDRREANITINPLVNGIEDDSAVVSSTGVVECNLSGNGKRNR